MPHPAAGCRPSSVAPGLSERSLIPSLPHILEDTPSRHEVVLPSPAELSRFFSLSHSTAKPATFLVYEVGGNIGKFPCGK